MEENVFDTVDSITQRASRTRVPGQPALKLELDSEALTDRISETTFLKANSKQSYYFLQQLIELWPDTTAGGFYRMYLEPPLMPSGS